MNTASIQSKNASVFCIGISVFFMLSFPLVGNPSGVVRSTQQYRKATRKIPDKPE